MNKLMVSLVMAACVVLISCNTLQGVGRDVEKVGEVIQKSTR
jgi:predicted small secreted protein